MPKSLSFAGNRKIAVLSLDSLIAFMFLWYVWYVATVSSVDLVGWVEHTFPTTETSTGKEES